jgi:hypothetical protein
MTLYDEKPNQVDAERFTDASQGRIAAVLSGAGYKDIKVRLGAFGDVEAMEAKTDDGVGIKIEYGQWLVDSRDRSLIAMDPAIFRMKYRLTPEDTANQIVKAIEGQ